MADFNSKYSGEQVEALLDQVASGNAGGGGGEVVIKDNIYVATFSTEDLEALMDDTANILSIPIDFIRAVLDKKTILMPTGRGYGNGYAVVTDASGYIGNTYDIAGVAFSVLVGRDIISVDQDNDIVDGALLINHNCISIVTIPDSASVEEIEQAIEDLPTIRDNAAKGATALQYYVTTFGLNDLFMGEDLFQEQVNKVNLLAAIRANKLILMPQDTSNPESGFIVLACSVNDFLYIDFTLANQVFHIETVINNPDIYASEITITTFATQDGVGISSIEQTTTSNADGGSNVVTVTLTNGSTSTFTIKNGSKGSVGDPGSKGDKGDKGDDGKDGATFTPSVDSAGNLSWSNNKGLANPPTVNIKGPKGDKGDAGEGGGGSSGGGDNSVEELDFEGDADFVISELLPNKKYVVFASYISNTPSLTISSLGGNLSEEESTIDSFYALIYTDYRASTGGSSVELSLYLPDDGGWHWANDIFTQMKLNKIYEMSIIRHNDYGNPIYYVTIAEYS